MNKKTTIGYYRKMKWICFFTAILSAFLPSTIATACLFPLVEAGAGAKIAVGLIVIAINLAMLGAGVLRAFKVQFPLFNWIALVDLVGGLIAEQFTAFYSSLKIIEVCAVAGSIAFAVLWHYFLKYSAQLLTAKTNKEMGLI